MRFLKSEAGAIILWLAASLLAAALLTPYLYDAGKALALSAETKDYPRIIESVAGSAGRADPDRFFSRALLISGLALVPLLIRRIKAIPRDPSSIATPSSRLSWNHRLAQLGTGILIGTLCLGALALILHLAGAADPKDEAFSASRFFSKALIPALGAGVIEELIFRGLILGLWLRASSAITAWIGSSLFFAFVHFLKAPPGMEISDPRAWYAGLEILGSTLGHFTNAEFFITEFSTLAIFGLILAWSRTRTNALWFPIGLHAGLVLALKTFTLTRATNTHSPLYPWFIGTDLKTGILPIVALGVCFLACFFALKLFGEKPATP
ncbi:MAG: CPBP family intramembrane glutamic endopeptidase [Luteolibacter sp.]